MAKPYVPNDKWSQKAAELGYRARSVFKLMELDEKFDLLQAGMTVVDIGAAPGSWLQYAKEKVGPSGRVFGFDLTPIEPIAENVITEQIDALDRTKVESALRKHGFEHPDLVLSDIAPNTSGVRDVDQWKSVELATAVSQVARSILSVGGRCVIKVFRGGDFDEFFRRQKAAWRESKVVEVTATRESSREVYVVLRK